VKKSLKGYFCGRWHIRIEETRGKTKDTFISSNRFHAFEREPHLNVLLGHLWLTPSSDLEVQFPAPGIGPGPGPPVASPVIVVLNADISSLL